MQQNLRLNVAITRSQNAFFVIADVQATLDQLSVNNALAEGEELDPESKGQDVVGLQQRRNIFEKIIEEKRPWILASTFSSKFCHH